MGKRFSRSLLCLITFLLVFGQTIVFASPGSFYDENTKRYVSQQQVLEHLDQLLKSKEEGKLWWRTGDKEYLNYEEADSSIRNLISLMGGIPEEGFTEEQLALLREIGEDDEFLASDEKRQELDQYWSVDKPTPEMDSFTVQPNIVTAGAETQIRITVQVPYSTQDLRVEEGAPSPVQLLVKKGEQEWTSLGYLLDNGDLNINGDEIKNDQVYSNFFLIQEAEKGSLQLRVVATTTLGLELSKEDSIEIVETTDGESVDQVLNFHQEMEHVVDEIFNGQNPPASLEEALTLLQQQLQNQEGVQQITSDENVLEIQYENGLKSFIAIQGEDERGGLSELTAEVTPSPNVEEDGQQPAATNSNESETHEASNSEAAEPGTNEQYQAGNSETDEPSESESQEETIIEVEELEDSQPQEEDGSEPIEQSDSEPQEEGNSEDSEPGDSQLQPEGNSEPAGPSDSEPQEGEQSQEPGVNEEQPQDDGQNIEKPVEEPQLPVEVEEPGVPVIETPVEKAPTERNPDAVLPIEQQTTGYNVDTPFKAKGMLAFNALAVQEEWIGSRNVLIWAPFAAEFAPYDETDGIINKLNESELGFDYSTLKNEQADVNSLKNITDYGLVVLATHGAGGSWVGTGEIVTDAKKYEAEQKVGQMAIWQNLKMKKEGGVVKYKPVYAVNEKWFNHHLNGSFNKSVIVNNSCESTKTNKLWNVFSAKGAGAYYGYNKIVGSDFAVDRVVDLVDKMAVDYQTTGEAYTQQTGSNGAVWQMRGNQNLKFPVGLVNGSFEKGMQAWEKDGDGRAISGLGFLGPIHGQRMGIISTGLGYTVEHGSIEQTFQVPEDAETLSFHWNYMSEEFLEYIGSQYDDPFAVTISDENGNTMAVLDLSVSKIAAQFGAAKNVPGNLISISPDIVFDQGDVWMTNWQFTQADISAFQGKKVTLKFFATDAGDTIYSTAVLLDDIKVE